MKTDKLFYRIFLTEQSLISELIPEIPEDCQFDYNAPVVKEKEFRLDGLLTPLVDDDNFPLVFLEAQMQNDAEFYGRYFGGIFVYLHQYKITKDWRGLLILHNRKQNLGNEKPYQDLLDKRVQRIFLSDLLTQDNLSPNVALLKLIIIPKKEAVEEANKILASARNEQEFKVKLDLVEAILVNKFPKLSIEEIQKMMNLREADITQTKFYQQVWEIGHSEGRTEGLTEGIQIGRFEATQVAEANLVIRLLNRRCGTLPSHIEGRVRCLSIPQLESLGEALLDFQGITDLENWLRNNSQI
ncbi:MAG: DUF2887 domain-containing protein [Cyanobacterium sp. T60_A2020_053]|nr:DUF2887 domain-containing protein [Cyanobacterium sp. T60_A2020_053]